MAKIYDEQKARFLSSVATCMPPLSGDVMNGWSDNPKALKKYLSGLSPNPMVAGNRWREENGVTYSSVENDDTTDEDWITRLESKDFRLDGEYLYCGQAKEILQSPDLKQTSSGPTEVAVLRGCLFEDNDRTMKKVRQYAEAFRTPDKRKLGTPKPELACLTRLKFTNKEIEAMGLWEIVVMHKPINDSHGRPCLLSVRRSTYGGYKGSLIAFPDRPDGAFGRDVGFAFAVSSR